MEILLRELIARRQEVTERRGITLELVLGMRFLCALIELLVAPLLVLWKLWRLWGLWSLWRLWRLWRLRLRSLWRLWRPWRFWKLLSLWSLWKGLSGSPALSPEQNQ